MTNDWSDTGYHEIRLEHKQLAIVFFIAVAFGIVLFLLGVWVGRGNAPASSIAGEAVEKVESEEPKAATEKEAAPTFFEKKHSEKTAGTISSEPASVPSTPPVEKTASSSKPKAGARTYTLQAGAFSTEDNAKKAAMDLEKAGYVITVATPEAKDKKKLYRVLVGEFATREEALAAKKRLEAMGFKNLVPK